MAGQETVERSSIRYQLTKYIVDFFFHRYLRTEVVGSEKLDPNKSYIFAPNHQGALMDALAILGMKCHWQPVFLARADIFKNPKIASILYFLKILPIFRIRDGYENLAQNDKIFQKTMEVLRNKNGLVILPEGNHGGFKRLRQLKKGIARIAFQAEDFSGGELDLQIVPIGIDYSDYVRVRSHLLIRVGEPFSVKNYMDLYHKNNAHAYNSLMEDLGKRMKAEMINIETEEDYDAYMCLLNMFTGRYVKQNKLSKTQNQRFIIDKKLIAAMDNMRFDSYEQYSSMVEKLKFCDNVIRKNGLCAHAAPFSNKAGAWLPFKAIALFVTLPLFVYGYVNNFLEIFIPYKASSAIKDNQFISSVRNVVAMLVFPLLYIVQTLLFGLIAKCWVLTLAYFVSLPIGLILAYLWRKNFYRFIKSCRLSRLVRKQHSVADKLNLYSNQIYKMLEEKIAND